MSFLKKLRAELTEDEKKLPGDRSFVRKCFLAGGAMSNPERTYHLEFSLAGDNAHRLMRILEGFDLHARTIKRKTQTVVYIKEADEIADCLKIMGAARSLLDFEELRVRRQVSNNINRRVNFEAANLSKTANAAYEQIEAIKKLDAQVGLANIPKPLEDVARLRLANENLTLEEIGVLLDPPVGKSGVSHRMRKLKKLAIKQRKLDYHD